MQHPWLEGLNAEQRRAAEAAGKSVMIMAGPGTGKTRTLAARVAELVRGRRVAAREVLALTFTVKAAEEMRERIARLADARVVVQTFHGLAQGIAKEAGVERRVVRDDERLTILRELRRPSTLKGLSPRDLALAVSRAKNAIEIEDLAVRGLVQAYRAVLEERSAWDYDDMLGEAYRLLAAGEGRAYQHVLVDEFQDTSEVQYEMARLLAAEGSLFAIGDERQAIYGFRGAGGGMFARFRADFPEAEAVSLTRNYRSAPEIVALGNAVFPESVDLVSEAEIAGRARVFTTLNEYSEADWVVGEVEAAVGGTDMLNAGESAGETRGRGFQDFAVIYRTHAVAKALKSRLETVGIPYQVAGEGSPYERPEVRSVLAGLRFLANQGEETSESPAGLEPFARLSRQQLGVLIEGWRVDAVELGLVELARRMAAQLGAQSEKADLAQLLMTLARFEKDERPLEAAVKYFDRLSENDFYDPLANALTLLTIHASKGLEFTRVFLIGANEGVLPHARPGAHPDLEEERRLFFVGVTRAKDELDIVATKFRSGKTAELSRFVTQLPAGVLRREADPALPSLERKLKLQRAKRSQGTLF
jgi:superfamily I DNA/RNA helicase